MSTATEFKQVLAALCGAQLRRRRLTVNEARLNQLPTSWKTVGHFDQKGRDVRGKATIIVLLAIGMSQECSDFHYGKKCAQAGSVRQTERESGAGYSVRLSELLGSSASAYA